MDKLNASLAHVGYVVKNIDKATARFEREGATLLIEPTPDPIQKVYISLLRTTGDVEIELVSPLGSEGSPVDSRLARGGGLDHLCYYVEDVASALQQEEENGSIIVCEPTFACAFNRTIGFTHRRTGLIVEYMSSKTVAAP